MSGWHPYFIKMADLVASKSKDRSTKVGAVIVGPDNEVRSTGYNGFPRGINDDVDSRHDRPSKYDWTEHAERNAVYNAARTGVSLKGCTLYLNFAPCPCLGCSRAIIQSGIVRIVVPEHRPFPGKGDQWAHELAVAQEMLAEAGVEIVRYTAHPLLPQPVSKIFDKRVSRVLSGHGISHIRDLVINTEFSLLVLSDINKKLLIEINDTLARHGLSLGMKLDL